MGTGATCSSVLLKHRKSFSFFMSVFMIDRSSFDDIIDLKTKITSLGWENYLA